MATPLETTLAVIPPGKTFTPEELVFHAHQSLEDALAAADLIVSCPHSGTDIPAELLKYIAPTFTRRLQFDFTDCSTAPVARAWARIDPRIIYVENPHPRLVRDPNRARPADPRASLREAFARVRAAGAWNRVDLTGCDAVRPVSFSFFPLLTVPSTEDELDAMAGDFTAAAARGVDVYDATRRDLIARALDLRLARGVPSHLFFLSFHDTMNHTTRRDGAVDVDRAPADLLPGVVALSNRGDENGDPRGDAPVTLDPGLIRLLAESHRSGFRVADPAEVALNRPYLGSQEIITTGAAFRDDPRLGPGSVVTAGAVQAEFRREYLLGEANAAHIAAPGTDWPAPDASRVALLASHMKASWDEFRAAIVGVPTPHA
ncbi:hypothetical protein Afil01_25260 [Actinorhabdospora filicis]|uniref:N-formylglutamate amidohydrolase n=1 Tax=Actinorhabdospora filicis TaxID=1785913 RepID=A0A9W6W8M5_9ACTN|nr:N-formylglutamate amidohydrolase [Actinorhabdospora filicis]GLZ77719.1 hypothetical protein Afil01_25260 [Actinorhabdospora filicis]